MRKTPSLRMFRPPGRKSHSHAKSWGADPVAPRRQAVGDVARHGPPGAVSLTLERGLQAGIRAPTPTSSQEAGRAGHQWVQGIPVSDCKPTRSPCHSGSGSAPSWDAQLQKTWWQDLEGPISMPLKAKVNSIFKQSDRFTWNGVKGDLDFSPWFCWIQYFLKGSVLAPLCTKLSERTCEDPSRSLMMVTTTTS